MTWTSPVVDRTAADVTGRTSKGFFNISDWVRIYENTQAVNDRILEAFGVVVPFMLLVQPSMAIFPTAASINNLVNNIEQSRIHSGLAGRPDIPELKTDWGEGIGAAAPNYNDVNGWENTLLVIYTWLEFTANYQVYCGVARAGQTRYWQNRWRTKSITQLG